ADRPRAAAISSARLRAARSDLTLRSCRYHLPTSCRGATMSPSPLARGRAAGLTCLALLAVANPASAQVIAYDPFSQPVGPLTGSASSGGGAAWPSNGPRDTLGGLS